MHHEKSYKFSDCDGKVANYYVSKLISGGTVEGFLEAIKMHQDYYSSRGSEAKVVPLIQYKRSETDDEEIFRVSSMVIYPNLKERTDWISRDDFTEKDTEEFSAFIDIHRRSSRGLTLRVFPPLHTTTKSQAYFLSEKHVLIPWRSTGAYGVW